MPDDISVHAAKRRTFAIISHPDAGKTTLTEKFLLFSGAVVEAGAVRARDGRRSARSDWMEMERQRGISISSTALKFTYRDHTFNLLDTPGHRDFSEDTYRVLAAADAVIMVLDIAKGIESQTLKLFEVSREQHLPIITFLNKCDRPGRDPIELLDEIESMISLTPAPVTWPVGIPGAVQGAIDRSTDEFIAYERTARGATIGREHREPTSSLDTSDADVARALDEIALFDAVDANFDSVKFLQGTQTPVFVGSALTNFGVGGLLDAVIDLAPAPSARVTQSGSVRPLDAPFSGFVFKIQANMNPSHRDHVAFVRVCSGQFERGMVLQHTQTGRPFPTKYATSMFGAERDTVEVAYPGDIVGLVNASELQIGDTLYLGEPVEFPPMIAFPPELFAWAHVSDTSKSKQFRRGLAQLAREGVVQVFHDPWGDTTPMLGAVGTMQFEVLEYRMAQEFGAGVRLSHTAYKFVRRTDEKTADALRRISGVAIVQREDDAWLALFENEYRLERLAQEHKDWMLERLLNHTGAIPRSVQSH